VGVDGIDDERFALVTASGLSRSAFSSGSAVLMLVKFRSTSPEAFATTLSAAPL
jgi:hypothetical protein